VGRIAPAGRRGAYQGAWALIASFSMGSALLLSSALRDAIGWPARGSPMPACSSSQRLDSP